MLQDTLPKTSLLPVCPAAVKSRSLMPLVADPVSVSVDTFGTAIIDEEKISMLIQETFDLKPASIIQRLNLLRPIYRQTAAYGHFGRELDDFTWEKTDYAGELRKKAGI